MGETIITEKILQEARRYAICIIGDATDFKAFSINMLDYAGEAFLPYLRDLYKEMSPLLFTQGLPQDDYNYVDSLPDYTIMDWFHQFRAQQQDRNEFRYEDFKENIDELQFLVASYRQREDFQRMLDFIGRFYYLAPYNAVLVEMQKPGAVIVLKGKEWIKYNRMLKPNAQRLITMRNFGPIQCMFDLSDTEPIPGLPVTKESELLEKFDKMLKRPEGTIDKKLLDTLVENLPSYGIYLDISFNATNTYGGYIKLYSHEIKVPLNVSHQWRTNSRFLISVNKNQSPTEMFHTICHELGHLFCRHLTYDPTKKRILSLKEKEFEAETVAWLVCKRHGVINPSEEYLATYTPEGEIPICSTDYILKAVTEVEKMLKGPVYAKSALWYKEDRVFKEELNQMIKNLKGNKKAKQTEKRF